MSGVALRVSGRNIKSLCVGVVLALTLALNDELDVCDGDALALADSDGERLGERDGERDDDGTPTKMVAERLTGWLFAVLLTLTFQT